MRLTPTDDPGFVTAWRSPGCGTTRLRPRRGRALRLPEQDRILTRPVWSSHYVAVEQWLQRDLLTDGDELRRALRDMIADSSNDATGLVVDLLTGTTSGPELHGERWELWTQQRCLINGWLQSLAWPELEAVNCCQKTGRWSLAGTRCLWGRQQQPQWLVHRCDSPDDEAVMTGAVVSPLACRRLQGLLRRSLDQQRQADPENQVDGSLVRPGGCALVSKAGWMSQARHDGRGSRSPIRSHPPCWWCSTGPDRARDESLCRSWHVSSACSPAPKSQ